jgi:hypothetical protein
MADPRQPRPQRRRRVGIEGIGLGLHRPGRLALEAPWLTLVQLQLAIEALDGLPTDDTRLTLRELARRAQGAAGGGRTTGLCGAAASDFVVGAYARAGAACGTDASTACGERAAVRAG